jgi:hypothetical protein
VTKAVEFLPRKHAALSLIPHIIKIKKKKNVSELKKAQYLPNK